MQCGIVLILFLLTSCAGKAILFEKTDELCIRGDANKNKIIGTDDFEFYINAWLAPEKTKYPKKICCVDLNNDAKIDDKDMDLFFYTFYEKEGTLGKC